jgi:hypothetical protein
VRLQELNPLPAYQYSISRSVLPSCIGPCDEKNEETVRPLHGLFNSSLDSGYFEPDDTGVVFIMEKPPSGVKWESSGNLG